MARQKKQMTAEQYRSYAVFMALATVAFVVMGFVRADGFTSAYDYVPFGIAALALVNVFIGLYYYKKLK